MTKTDSAWGACCVSGDAVSLVCPYSVLCLRVLGIPGGSSVEGTSGVASPAHLRWSNPAVVGLCVNQGGESARRRGWDTTRREDSWDHCRH